MTNGTYTEHLAAVREILARLDERSEDAKEDREEIKAHLEKLNGSVATNRDNITALNTRQKVIGGGVGAVGLGAVSLVYAILRGLL